MIVYFRYRALSGDIIPSMISGPESYDELVQRLERAFKKSTTPIVDIYPELLNVEQKASLSIQLQETLEKTSPREVGLVYSLKQCIQSLGE